ncbi:flavin-dependent oxidoreductase [Pseudonocardia alaniniphila]|uniref:Flavin-dependent oxidoreductase n=1 Tax=Pseudonocardia alaniniphila TaxID=75291 RepID=A0ABS9TJA2_9PSEU|nr:flavin-dependent oxidoreductase [Pseudonocardia alaniniphila]MCH6168624.1 flavin-dependent oxidoreductase [Pseudonocardia alaniniphila]
MTASNRPEIVIVGAGVAGLVLALELHDAGIPCRVYESVPEIRALGVGINVLPHAGAVLGQLSLEADLSAAAVLTRESVFFTRFGQLAYREPAGRDAGYPDPQYSIHRGDLQAVLLSAVRERLGPDAVVTGHTCTGTRDEDGHVTAEFRTADGALVRVRGDAVIACDGVNSVIRKQLHPKEGEPRYSGVTMWRGVTVWEPFLSGGSMVRIGWLDKGKLVIYPIRNDVDAQGRQLVNWVAERETPQRTDRDWIRQGELADFASAYADWHFDWLDVPAFLEATDSVLEYPMVDQEPLDWWTAGRVTLLGDAAHPMVPRGSNGAGQAVLDARALRTALVEEPDVHSALQAYEHKRRPATAAVVRTNRANPPDAILREVSRRSGDRPFARIEDVISREELAAISDGYKDVAGYALGTPERVPEQPLT